MGYCNHRVLYNWEDMDPESKPKAKTSEVLQMIADNKVMVFSKSYCPHCTQTK